MKAAVVLEPENLKVLDVSDPEMGDYDALCEIIYGATCTGTDLHIIEDAFPFKAPYPTIIGHESIGRVIKTGAKVKSFKVGDVITRVGTPAVGEYSVTWGGFAEKGVVGDKKAMEDDDIPPNQHKNCGPNFVLPENIDLKTAPMIITWRETYSYISRMGVGEGSSILIVGSGGNALSFAALAKILNCSEIAMIGAENRKKHAEKAGVTNFYDYRQNGHIDNLKEKYIDGFDFIIDVLGRKNTMDEVLCLLKKEGTFGIYGVDNFGQQQITPLNAKGSFTFYKGGYSEIEAHDQVIKFIQENQFDVSVWYDPEKPYNLDDICDAFNDLRERKHVKALIKIL